MPPKPEIKNKVLTQSQVKAWTQPQVKVEAPVLQPQVKVEPPVTQTTRPVSKPILKKPVRIQTPPKPVSINLPYEIFNTLPHELPSINMSYNQQPYIDSLNSVGSLLFPNINNFNKYENLTHIVKNLNIRDIELLYNFRTYTCSSNGQR